MDVRNEEQKCRKRTVAEKRLLWNYVRKHEMSMSWCRTYLDVTLIRMNSEDRVRVFGPNWDEGGNCKLKQRSEQVHNSSEGCRSRHWSCLEYSRAHLHRTRLFVILSWCRQRDRRSEWMHWLPGVRSCLGSSFCEAVVRGRHKRSHKSMLYMATYGRAVVTGIEALDWNIAHAGRYSTRKGFLCCLQAIIWKFMWVVLDWENLRTNAQSTASRVCEQATGCRTWSLFSRNRLWGRPCLVWTTTYTFQDNRPGIHRNFATYLLYSTDRLDGRFSASKALM